MKIIYSNLNRLERYELYTFMKSVIEYTERLLEDMPELFTNKFAELKTAFTAYDDVLAQERRLSPEGLIEAEEKRDHAVRKLYSLAKEYSNYPYDSEKELAADEILKVFKVYGTGSEIARKTQDIETGVIENLLQDLIKTQARQEALETLHLMRVVDSLTSSNNEFSETQLTRRSENAEFLAGAVKESRTEVQDVFMSFVNVVNALAIVEGEAKYVKLKKFIPDLLDDYVTESKRRGKRKEKEVPEEEVPVEQTTTQ